MKSWKTTIIGCALCVSGFISTYPPKNTPEDLINIAKFVNFGGLAALGISAKDNNVSGGDK